MMKMTVGRTPLLRALGYLQHIAVRSATFSPILSHTLLRIENNKLSLTATDNEMEMIVFIEGSDIEIAEEGETTTSASLLYEIVRKMPDSIEMECEYIRGDEGTSQETEGGDFPTSLVLRSEDIRFNLACLRVEDFPHFLPSEEEKCFTIDGTAIRELIDRTRFSMAGDGSRSYLQGIYLHLCQNAENAEAGEEGTETGGEGFVTLRSVATDGHRLAKMDVSAPEDIEDIPGVIIPRKTIMEVRKILEGTKDEKEKDKVEIGLSQRHIKFKFSDIIVTSKLIDGTFPDYERVIPQSTEKVFRVDAKRFTQAVDRVSTIMSATVRRPSLVRLSLQDSRLTVSATSSDSGSGEDKVSITGYDGEEFTFGFNARYLLDIVEQFDGDNDVVEFKFSTSEKPTILQCQDSTKALYVLMPMRI